MVEIRGDKKVLVTPVTAEDLADIKIGDIVSGEITELSDSRNMYTARKNQKHK